MKKLFTLCAVLATALSANAAMVEQTYEYTFTEEHSFKAVGEWQLGAAKWNVAAVKYDGTDAPCSWNGSNSAQQIGGQANYPKTVTMTTTGIPGTIKSVTIAAQASNKTTYACALSVGSETVDLGEAKKIDKPLTATDLNASGEIKFVFTQTAEVTADLKGALLVQKISVVYESEVAGAVDFSYSFADMQLAIDQTSPIVLPAQHPDITFSSSNPQIVAVEGQNLKGVASGTATITAAWNASDSYNAGSASFAVEVTKNQIVTFDFTTKNYGLTPVSEQPESFADMRISETPVTIDMTGSFFLLDASETEPQLLRLLGNSNTTSNPAKLTFSVPEGHKILRIEFVGNNTGKWESNVGKKSNGVWLPEDTEVANVTLTYNGDCKINQIMVEQYPATTTGIENIIAAGVSSQGAEYYDLNGVRLNADSLRPGIYIVRNGSDVKKIIIR